MNKKKLLVLILSISAILISLFGYCLNKSQIPTNSDKILISGYEGNFDSDNVVDFKDKKEDDGKKKEEVIMVSNTLDENYSREDNICFI